MMIPLAGCRAAAQDVSWRPTVGRLIHRLEGLFYEMGNPDSR
jgi:hypothetical protein